MAVDSVSQKSPCISHFIEHIFDNASDAKTGIFRGNFRWTLIPLRRHFTSIHLHGILMMTSSNGNIFRVTGPLCGEFTGPGEFPAQRPVTRSFDVFFDLRPNKRLNKQPWGRWFETLSWSLWRHRNVVSFSSKRKDCNCLCHLSVERW